MREVLGTLNVLLMNILILDRGRHRERGAIPHLGFGYVASALEAVIATIFLDQGIAVAGDCISGLFNEELQKAVSRGAVADYKSRLQELIQARQQSTPVYHLVEALGPAHSRTFTVEVRVADTVLGRGSGKSKKIAETEAARSALERLSADFTP